MRTSFLRDAAGKLMSLLAIGGSTGVLCGVGAAIFLFALDRATAFRGAHEAIVIALPAAGWGLGHIYRRFGSEVLRGSHLVQDTHARLGPFLPPHLAPFVLLATVATHLFGGSAGREGTAVQMGAGLADGLARLCGSPPDLRRQWLRAGVAAGFGAVFGTPLAGAAFALEFFGGSAGGWAPAAVGAVVGDRVARALGAQHVAYAAPSALPFDGAAPLRWAALALALAAAGVAFLAAVRGVAAAGRHLLPSLPGRMAAGGGAVLALWLWTGASEALGLGTTSILEATQGRALSWPLLATKGAATALTVGSGFAGGEVTPLFFLGAGIASALAAPLGLPVDGAAAVGMAALFGACARAPLSLALMGAELFGWAALAPTLWVTGLTAAAMRSWRLYAEQGAHPLWSWRASAMPWR